VLPAQSEAEHPTQALVPQSGAVPQLAVDVGAVLEQWKQYQTLTKQLLVPDDYQKIGKKKFKKKSAWRKYSRAFGLSEVVPLDPSGAPDLDKVVKVVERADDGFPLVSASFVIVEAPGGRQGTGYQEVHVLEKCCPARLGDTCRKAQWDSHYCCPKDCDGREHWSHPGDLPATAHTRAKNRAISDLIGAGEVSAEEMDASQGGAATAATRRPPKVSASQALRDRIQLGLVTLAKHRSMGTKELLAEFSAYTNNEGTTYTAKTLDHLLGSSKWAGATWNKMKDELKKVLGDEYEKVFVGSK
jgi:hypothetical protein